MTRETCVGPDRLRVGLLGSGWRANEWGRVLSEQAVVDSQIDGSTEAVVIAPGSHDPFGAARDALRSGAAVLFAAPFQLNPWQAGSLEELSRLQGRILRFAEPYRYQKAFPFLQRLLEGREPFWRPLYLRSLYLKSPDSGARLDELAADELALYDGLLGAAPRCVSAVPVGQDSSTQVSAASFTVEYDDGPTFHSMISLAEGSVAHELVAVAPERTMLLDQLNPEQPLRVLGTGDDSHELSFTEDDVAGDEDVLQREAIAFIQAVRSHDVSYCNAARWTKVAAIWWAGRRSMSLGGSVEVPAHGRAKAEPPLLKVIEGGGTSRKRSRRRRTLTLVAN